MDIEKIITSCVLSDLAKRMMSVEPYLIEVFLTLCSLWVSFVLFNPPSNFAAFPKAFHLVAVLQSSESAWASLALFGALTKLVGLALSPMRFLRYRELATILRCIGLGVSGLFWTLMALSTLIGNTDTIFGMPGFLMAVSAWWALLRFPRFPGEG